jgi:hypothetical protein
MCVLRVYGPRFDPVGYLAAGSRLEPIRVYVPGEPIFDKRLATTGSADRGFHASVSNRPWTDWDGQVEDATAFLVEHREELGRLRSSDAVTRIHLDFPTEVDPQSRHVTLWGGFFPTSFLRAAADAGVDVYVTLYFATGSDREEAEGADE